MVATFGKSADSMDGLFALPRRVPEAGVGPNMRAIASSVTETLVNRIVEAQQPMGIDAINGAYHEAVAPFLRDGSLDQPAAQLPILTPLVGQSISAHIDNHARAHRTYRLASYGCTYVASSGLVYDVVRQSVRNMSEGGGISGTERFTQAASPRFIPYGTMLTSPLLLLSRWLMGKADREAILTRRLRLAMPALF